MRIQYLLLIFVLLTACGGAEQPTAQGSDLPGPAPGFPGRVSFATSGTEVDGVPTRLKGVNMVDPIAQATWDLPEDVGVFERSYYEEARRWGADIVRVPIHPAFWREDPTQSMAYVRQLIGWCTELGLYAILDFHAIGMLHQDRFEELATTTTKAEFLEFWRSVSMEFSGVQTIAAYGLLNEPVNLNAPLTVSAADWVAWKADAVAAIDTIRTYDSDTAILIGGLHWSYDLSFAAADPIARANVAYDAHVYPFTPAFKSWEQAVGVPSQSLPVFVGEWGWDVTGEYDEKLFGATGEYATAIITFLNDHNYSWTAWVFSPRWDPRMLSDWSYNTTAFGALVRQELGQP